MSTGTDDTAAARPGDPARRPTVSVILPTIDGVDACREVAALLGPDDELLVVCDTDDDPIARAEADLPAGARVVTAGPPEGCSGKANAVAAGIEAAEHDRLVMTDDDFSRPASWLEQLCADYERDGPSSELPLFVGSDPLSRLLEPLYAHGTLGIYRNDVPWGGALIFDRSDIDDAQVRRELRRTVSDDGLLSEHLEVTQHRRLREVEIGGSLRASLERHVRFMQIFRWFAPRGLALATGVLTLLTAVCLIVPVLGAALATLLTARVYAVLGTERRAVLWSPVALLLFVPLLVFALSRRTFVWSGRRYRWRGKFDTTVE